MVRSIRQGGETGVDITCVRVEAKTTHQGKQKKQTRTHDTRTRQKRERGHESHTHMKQTQHIKTDVARKQAGMGEIVTRAGDRGEPERKERKQ